MIADRLEKIGDDRGLGGHFERAIRWLQETDPEKLAPGTVWIDDKKVYATLSENLLDRENPTFEVHRLYADIQLVLEGKERFLLGWRAGNIREEPERDVAFCDAEEALPFTLGPGQFAIFMPGELHSPGNPDGSPSICRKLVVKVRVE